MSYGDYVEQLTYLLFLKMDDENVRVLDKPSVIPVENEDLRSGPTWNMGTRLNVAVETPVSAASEPNTEAK
jgi:hypothetical protein